jgi:hypothetical protein
MEEPAVNPGWRKSSYSNGGSANCVEVGATPGRKSSYSDNGGTACVEAGHFPGAIIVRDTTRHGTGPVLRLSPAAWSNFTASLKG